MSHALSVEVILTRMGGHSLPGTPVWGGMVTEWYRIFLNNRQLEILEQTQQGGMLVLEGLDLIL